jgi:hypothetical protein
MTLTVDVAGGHDRNDVPPESIVPTDFVLARQSGPVSTAAVALRYRVGRDRSYLTGTGRAFTSYSTTGIEDAWTQAWTREATLAGEVALGARTGLIGGAVRQYQPVFLFGAFDALPGLVEGTAPDLQTTLGVTRQTWRSDEYSLGVYRNITRRQVADVRYERRSQQPLEGIGLESGTETARAHYAWNPGRAGGLDLSYIYSDTLQRGQPRVDQHLTTHAATAGVHFRRRLSASRNLDLALSGGFSRSWMTAFVDQPEAVINQPTFSISFGTALTRSWAVRAEAGRQVGVLYGLTPEPFATRAVSLGTTGNLSRRLQANVLWAYSWGDATQLATDSYENMVGNNSLQYAVSRRVATFILYSYYRQSLNEVVVVQPFFPSFYERHSIRVGASIWLSLLGRP